MGARRGGRGSGLVAAPCGEGGRASALGLSSTSEVWALGWRFRAPGERAREASPSLRRSRRAPAQPFPPPPPPRPRDRLQAPGPPQQHRDSALERQGAGRAERGGAKGSSARPGSVGAALTPPTSASFEAGRVHPTGLAAASCSRLPDGAGLGRLGPGTESTGRPAPAPLVGRQGWGASQPPRRSSRLVSQEGLRRGRSALAGGPLARATRAAGCRRKAASASR